MIGQIFPPLSPLETKVKTGPEPIKKKLNYNKTPQTY